MPTALRRYVQGAGSVNADNLNTFVQSCDNVAQLRAITGVSGMQIYARGTTVPNDGGQANFYWAETATAPDNGVTIIAPTDSTVGRWISLDSATSGFDYLIIDTVADLEAATIASHILVVETLGYYMVGDFGAARYVRTSGSGPGNVQSVGGAWWKICSQAVFVEMFGAEADWNGTTGTDNSGTFQIAQNYATANGVILYMGPGQFGVFTFQVTSGLVLRGQGKRNTRLVLNSSTSLASKGIIYANSGSAGAMVGPLTFEGFTIDGRVQDLGFQEPTHNMSLNGVEGVIIQDVEFLGFRGDGLYLGSGIVGGDELHNKNVQVLSCVFDGVNNDNRNGISALDYDTLIVKNNQFIRCTRSSMPGAIDVEPNSGSTFAVLNGLTADANTFEDIGGGVGTICFPIAAGIALPTGTSITNNRQVGNFRTFLFVDGFRAPATADLNMDMVVEGNSAIDGPGAPFLLYGCKGITFRDNSWQDLDSAAQVGAGGGVPVSDVKVYDNFTRVGSGGVPFGLGLFDVEGIVVSSDFIDCGNGDAGSCGVQFDAGTSSYVDINESRFSAPAGLMSAAIDVTGAHTLTPSTNQFYQNVLRGLSNAFGAWYSDSIWTAFTPVVVGGVTPGTGTYSTQQGQFQINGGAVNFQCEVVWTAHTGTGQIYVPTPTNNDTTVAFRPVSLQGNNLTSITVPVIGLIHFNKVQVYQYSSGAIVAQAISAAGELYISGQYPWAA